MSSKYKTWFLASIPWSFSMTLISISVGAAAVAGLFWGFMYLRLGNLASVIISHAVWSTVIFAVFPTM